MINLRWVFAAVLTTTVPLACSSDDGAFTAIAASGAGAAESTAGSTTAGGTNAGSSSMAGSVGTAGSVIGAAGMAAAGAPDMMAGAPATGGAPAVPECLATVDCAGNPAGEVCDPATHACVACLDNSTCNGATPYCDVARNVCVACQSDANCGNPSLFCAAGACECKNGLTLCGGNCVDTQTTLNHCGQCDLACDALFESCGGGKCLCDAGLTDCNGTCRDLQNDPNQCGKCGTKCGDGQVCSAGKCECRPGLTDCGGTCVDLQSNPNHCGACNNAACGQNQRCQTGACLAAAGGCGDTLQQCGSGGGRIACVNTDNDPLNCGDCGNACARDEVCADGECRKYAPALTCNTCPCNVVCKALVDSTTCCASATNGKPICVEGGSCPN